MKFLIDECLSHWKSWKPTTISSTRFLKSLSTATTSCASCVIAFRLIATDVGTVGARDLFGMIEREVEGDTCTHRYADEIALSAHMLAPERKAPSFLHTLRMVERAYSRGADVGQ